LNLLLQRDPSKPIVTIGDLYVDGVWQCYTLEDAVREVAGQPVETWKVPGATAIPAGIYTVIIDFSSRFGRPMPHVLNVPGFSGIRIHPGNYASDTEGCILVGSMTHADMVTNSRLAFNSLFTKLEDAETITIDVRNAERGV
jgi:hypothetical protein